MVRPGVLQHLHAEPGPRRRRQPPARRRRDAGRVVDRHPPVEVDRRAAPARRRREREVEHRGRVDARSTRVLDRHVQAELGRDVPHRDCRSHAADARELDGDAVGCARPPGGEQRVQRHDRLVEQQRHGTSRPHGRALLERRTWLLERVLRLARRAQEADRLRRRPAAVRVCDEPDGRAGGVTHCQQPLGIGVDVAAHLDLEPPVPGGGVAPCRGRRLLGRQRRDRPVELGRVAQAPAQRLAERPALFSRRRIPAGHVERRLDVGLAAHGLGHPGGDGARLPGIQAEQVRRELGHACARPRRERFGVERSERRHLAPAGDAQLGVDGDDDGVEARRGAGGGRIRAVHERLPLAVGADGGDRAQSPSSARRRATNSSSCSRTPGSSGGCS